MALLLAPQFHTFRDAKGYTWTMRYHIQYVSDTAQHVLDGWQVGANVLAALEGIGAGTLPLTNGVHQESGGVYGQISATAYGTAAQYLNCEDKLMVALYDAKGALHRFGIGSPVIAAFLADQETGKGSQLVDLVTAFTTAVGTGPAFAATRNGIAFASAVGSVLVRRRQRRKTTLVSKSSNLDEPGE